MHNISPRVHFKEKNSKNTMIFGNHLVNGVHHRFTCNKYRVSPLQQRDFTQHVDYSNIQENSMRIISHIEYPEDEGRICGGNVAQSFQRSFHTDIYVEYISQPSSLQLRLLGSTTAVFTHQRIRSSSNSVMRSRFQYSLHAGIRSRVQSLVYTQVLGLHARQLHRFSLCGIESSHLEN